MTPRITPAVATGSLAGLVAAAALGGPALLVAVLLLTTAALATGWPKLLALPTQRGSTTIVTLGGSTALLVVALTPDEPRLRWLPSVLALSVLAAFGHQLLRRDLRPRLVESVTGVVGGLVLTELAAAWVAVRHADGGDELVLAAAGAVAAAAAITALPWPQRLTDPLAVVAGGIGCALVAQALPEVASGSGALLGLAVGAVVAGLDRLFLHLPSTTSRQAGLSVGAAVISACGPVVYLVHLASS